MPGVTDQKSISEWDLPFDLVETVRPKDEDYWREYRTTPKAFVSLATGERLFGSRWGTISLLRTPVKPGEAIGDQFRNRFMRQVSPAALGMRTMPVKQMGLEASAGTTPFEWLFLGFSIFLIAAAVMLVALLFRLGIEQRASELGTLAATGVNRRTTSRLLAREGTVVAAVGASVGVVLGVLYAWLMVFGLRTWWLAAVSTPFIQLHVGWMSLLIGWVTGVVVSWITIRWSIRRLVRQPVMRLMMGNIASELHEAAGKWWRWFSWPVLRLVLVALVVVQCVAGFFLQGESQAGSFFGSGATALVLLLGEVRFRLRHLAT